jgi:hypothetical protein
MKSISIYSKIRFLPEHLRSEVNDFIDHLISKKKTNSTEKSLKFGSLKGKIEISDDFDEPIEDFIEYTK